MSEKIRTHKDLKVYQLSFQAGMEIFELSKSFPKEERYSLTDQIRRSSRSVSGNIAEAFRKRRYPKSFVAKLSDAEGEAAETQVWLDYAHACHYIDSDKHIKLNDKYEHIISMIMTMEFNPDKWTY
jgi:four helix bundle protein